MTDFAAIFAIFVLAGFVKGVIGLGLPTIAMGLLVLLMRPAEAASLLLVPSLLTNLWQAFTGPALRACIRRFWPMLVGICVGSWAGIGLMTDSPLATTLLGLVLLTYGATGFVRLPAFGSRVPESVLAPLVGAATGLLTAATGVAVVPVAPYLAALKLERELLVQMLGLSFTVSTVALAADLAAAGALHAGLAVDAAIALAGSVVGMALGQAVRARLSPRLFRQAFFVGLACFGAYLLVQSLA